MQRNAFTVLLMAATITSSAQSLQKPTVPEPSLKIVKTQKTRYGTGAGYMGLFDWNVSGGYISKDVTQTGMATPALSAGGGYAMFHLQESVLSNYFLAKKYKRNKRVKIGLQNTFDFGMGMGSAARRSTEVLPIDTLSKGLKFYLNYQFGIASAIRITNKVDIGYTYYAYSKTLFFPDTRSYHKARFRYSHLMAEYSFGGVQAIELKYLRGKKGYFGLGYYNYEQQYNAAYALPRTVNTSWYQISIGKVF